jgi:dTDP-4-amino-4,6-dideoxygalactose transaminase
MNQEIPYAKQSISAEDQLTVAESLKQPLITRGEKVKAFQEAVASNVGAEFAICFNSGSTALQASFFAANVTSSDRVMIAPNTFVASCGSAIARGAKPFFVDIDKASGNADIQKWIPHLNENRSRGKDILVPVHFSGIAIDMETLERHIEDPQTVVIEDAAHALGSSYPTGEKVGSCAYSEMTVFSFHPAKTITTGEGGMVTTNDPALYEKLVSFRNNGIYPNPSGFGYQVLDLTGNFHMTEMQAALGLSQLGRLDLFSEKRKKLVSHYRALLEGVPHIRLFSSEYDARTTYHLMVVQIDFETFKTDRETVMQKLKAEGIGTQVHYIPLYCHPAIGKRGCLQNSDFLEGAFFEDAFLEDAFPGMESYYARCLTLPLYYDLSFEDVERVVATLKKVLSIS